MFSSRLLSLLVLATSAALGASGCETVECGNGTIEIDGQCSLPDTVVDPSSCGTGTRFDASEGACVPDLVCGANTVAEQLPDGSVVCIGVGGGGGCDGEMPQCRLPSDPGLQATVCGTLVDIATGEELAEVEGSDATPTLCDQANPTADGPCSVQVRAFDPLQFAANPDNTPPLNVGGVFQDTCGRYAITDIPVPFNEFVAVATTNVFLPGENEGTTVANTYRQTGTSFGVRVGDRRTDIPGAVTDIPTDAGWTSTAGDPFGGMTFADVGVFVPVFTVNGTPTAGVTITASEQVLVDLDYYFSDAGAESRTTVDVMLDATGNNGTGLLTPTSLRTHAGIGGEPNGCEWSSDLAASIPNVVFFQVKLAHVLDEPTNNACPQP